MGEHTKGPIGIKNSGSRIIHQKDPDLCLFAVIDGEEQLIGEAYGRAELPAEANARLWAASPDLLAACRSARRAFAELNGEVSRDVWERLYEVTRVLDEAIGKATG